MASGPGEMTVGPYVGNENSNYLQRQLDYPIDEVLEENITRRLEESSELDKIAPPGTVIFSKLHPSEFPRHKSA